MSIWSRLQPTEIAWKLKEFFQHINSELLKSGTRLYFLFFVYYALHTGWKALLVWKL